MKKIILVTIAFCLAVGLGSISGCASGGGSDTGSDTASNTGKAASSQMAIPADSALAKVVLGASDAAVRKVLGDPDDTKAYMTGKAWIPFYFGPDTHRTDWLYRGQGRVVFSRNRYTAGLKVVRVMYNPSELE